MNYSPRGRLARPTAMNWLDSVAISFQRCNILLLRNVNIASEMGAVVVPHFKCHLLSPPWILPKGGFQVPEKSLSKFAYLQVLRLLLLGWDLPKRFESSPSTISRDNIKLAFSASDEWATYNVTTTPACRVPPYWSCACAVVTQRHWQSRNMYAMMLSFVVAVVVIIVIISIEGREGSITLDRRQAQHTHKKLMNRSSLWSSAAISAFD